MEAGARRALGAARAALVARIGPGVTRGFAGGFLWGGNEPVTRATPEVPGELHSLSPLEMPLLVNLEGLVQASKALAAPEGVPLDERARRVAAIPGERAAIQRQHAALVDRAAELGIQVAALAGDRRPAQRRPTRRASAPSTSGAMPNITRASWGGHEPRIRRQRALELLRRVPDADLTTCSRT